MASQTQKTSFEGPVGVLEALIDPPILPAGVMQRGVAFIVHPHPLFGGTMENKVTQTLARAYAQSGWQAVRFNFRGVGGSAGTHDNGRGELQDLLTAIGHFAPHGAIALAGFSFGAFVASQAIAALPPERQPQNVVLVGTAAGNFDVAPIPNVLHPQTLVVHGEVDDTIALSGTNFTRVDGGAGIDSLRFDFSATTVDLATMGNKIKGFEQFDLGSGGNTLKLRLGDVLNQSDETGAGTKMMINGSSGTVDLAEVIGAGGWSNTGTTTVNGNTYNIYHYAGVGASTENDLWIQQGLTVN